MCHGFLASKDSGERLSHAVGCAFTVCLERKQRRDTECSVTMTFDTKNSTFTRNGSFRQTTLTERLHNERGIDTGTKTPSAIVPPQPKPHNPFAIERPHATPSMLERQGSFRAFTGLNSQSPFKRQMSLRLNDLPSNAERQKSFLEPLTNGHVRTVSPIPEVVSQQQALQQQQLDNVSALCKELSQGLSLLSRNDASDELNFNLQTVCKTATTSDYVLPSTMAAKAAISSPESGNTNVTNTITTTSDYISMLPTSNVAPIVSHISNRHRASISGAIATPIVKQISAAAIPTLKTDETSDSIQAISPTSSQKLSAIVAPNNSQLPKADQWLGDVVKSSSPAPRRAPSLSSHTRARSLTSASDPFDAEWVATVTKNDDHNLEPEPPIISHHSTNPFMSPPKPPAESFQLQL